MERNHVLSSISHVKSHLARSFIKCWTTPISFFTMRRVCISFGMSVPEVLFPCSSLVLPAPPTFPSTTYLHRALSAFPWLARLAATAHRRCSCSQGRKWAEHSATLIPGILDMYRSVSPLHTHLPLTHRPFWMHRFDPLRLLLGEVVGCWTSC